MDLQDLYRQVILDHNKSPRNFGRLDPCDASATGHNPLCGDRLHLSLRFKDDTVSDIAFSGSGCAISVASASMMSEAVKGQKRDYIEALYRDVHGLLTEAGYLPSQELGKLLALSGVREFPARVKCASLCWHTLHAALHPPAPSATAAANVVSTEQS
jgi:nitrogen fixation protein NifU and related proteins